MYVAYSVVLHRMEKRTDYVCVTMLQVVGNKKNTTKVSIRTLFCIRFLVEFFLPNNFKVFVMHSGVISKIFKMLFFFLQLLSPRVFIFWSMFYMHNNKIVVFFLINMIAFYTEICVLHDCMYVSHQ